MAVHARSAPGLRAATLVFGLFWSAQSDDLGLEPAVGSRVTSSFGVSTEVALVEPARERRQTFACQTSVLTPNVAVIPASTYENCTVITVLGLNIGVTTLGARVCYGCTNLRVFNIPNTNVHSLTYIGTDAFHGCSLLTLGVHSGALPMPNRLQFIGDGAFSGCTSITSVTFPETVAQIGAGAFMGATALANITFNTTTTQPLTINGSAFSETALTDVEIPGRVSLASGAFSNISSLHTIHAGPMQQAASGVFSSCFCGALLCPADVTPGLVVALCNCVVCGPTIAPTAAPTLVPTPAPSGAPSTAAPSHVPTTAPVSAQPSSAAPTPPPATQSPTAPPPPLSSTQSNQGTDESEIPNYDTVRRLTLWILVVIGVGCLAMLAYSARQWTKLMKHGMTQVAVSCSTVVQMLIFQHRLVRYVQVIFNLSKVGILIYAVQKPDSGPSLFALSFITLISKIQETLSLFDDNGVGNHSTSGVSVCGVGTFLIYCTTLVCLAIPTLALSALLWLNAATMIFDAVIARFVLQALRDAASVTPWKLNAYVIVQLLASAGSVALASYATVADSTDARLPLGDALIFVVANAAVQFFLASSDEPGEETKGSMKTSPSMNNNPAFVSGPGFATAFQQPSPALSV